MNTMIIGIAGGTGSGKTTLTEHLAARFGPNISVVHHDNYYKCQNRPFEERCKQNYDHPDAFDTDLMVQQLRQLKADRPSGARYIPMQITTARMKRCLSGPRRLSSWRAFSFFTTSGCGT